MPLEFRLGYADVPNVRTCRVHATLGRGDAFVMIHEAFLPLFFTRLHRLKGAVVEVRRAVIGYGRSRAEEVKAADDGEYFYQLLSPLAAVPAKLKKSVDGFF